MPDLDTAARAALSRGARRDSTITTDGARAIAEFRGDERHIFLQGPEGARIELIQREAAPRGPGHDRIGIAVFEIAAAQASVESFGASLAAAVTLNRPEGRTEVRFMALGSAMLALYQPPGPRLPPCPASGTGR